MENHQGPKHPTLRIRRHSLQGQDLRLRGLRRQGPVILNLSLQPINKQMDSAKLQTLVPLIKRRRCFRQRQHLHPRWWMVVGLQPVGVQILHLDPSTVIVPEDEQG